MNSRKLIRKIVCNEKNHDSFIGDVLLYELNSLEQVGLNKNCGLFRSGRHKNDIPSVCRFGQFDDAMKDALGTVSESGDSRQNGSSQTIISDNLTILGEDNNALVIAFYGGEHHLFRTEIDVNENGDFVALRCFAEFNCVFDAQEERPCGMVEISHTDNVSNAIREFGLRKIPDCYTKKYPLAVYCTWYYYGETVTLEDVHTNLEKIKEKKLLFDVFQIDDGWEKFPGQWEPNEKFPKNMKTVADKIKSFGLSAGIWTSPFVAHPDSDVWKKHPDWILKSKDDKPEIFNVNNTDFYIFDITIKETWDYFEKLYHKLTYEWGFTYHKLDFTRAPFVAKNPKFKNEHSTLVECYRSACISIRKGMGDESFFLMCGGLYDPLIGIVDAQRTSSDVLSMWSSTVQKNGKTLPFTVKQNLLRYYMNFWWNNDPDALMVRRNETMERNVRMSYGLLTDDEVKTCTLNQILGGGMVCCTEPLDKTDDDRLANLNHILPIYPAEIEIPNLMNCGRFPSQIRLRSVITKLDKFGKKYNRTVHAIVFINWSDNGVMMPYVTKEDFIWADEKYNRTPWSMFDFYDTNFWANLRAESRIQIHPIAPHSSTILIQSPAMDEHDNINTSGHYFT